MHVGYTLSIILWVLFAAGCAQQPLRETSNQDSSLQRWLDSDLAPYLARQLGEHPRFKDESVMLVRLDGADIQPEIDGLTRTLRNQIMDRLLTEPGVTLPWQPQQRPAQHHRRLDQLQCGRVRDADYYVGIEITRSANSEHRVSVRALDVRAGEWVSGFGRYWTGHLTASEESALQERRRDESLRGLRVLPFSSGHPDLAATYLANNLSCLLRQQDEDNLVIYAESLQSEQPRLRTLLSLIGNNLSRYREVRVTDRRKEANLLLRGETYEVQSGLYQVWVVLHPRHSGEHLSGMDTATWVHIQPAYTPSQTPYIAEPVYDTRPAIAALQLVRHNNPTGECQGQHTNRSGNGCPVLEVSVQQTEEVFIFVHGMRDGISRLSSGHCEQYGSTAFDTPGTLRYKFPSQRFDEPDWPTVYAIAVSDPHLAQQFRTHLHRLPDACGSAAGLRTDSHLNPWLKTVDRLIADNSDQAVWTARRIP